MSASQRDFDALVELVVSEDPADVDRAHEMAMKRMAVDPRARIVAAMAYDRIRALAGRPQKFGTQAIVRQGRRVAWPIDGQTTDSERAKWGLATLRVVLARIAEAPLVTKASLRRLLRARRQAITPEQALAWSQAIARHAEEQLRGRARDAVVACYWPLKGEADALPLARALADGANARLALPVVDGDDMVFREWRDDASLVPAGFGTSGPASHAPELTPSIVLAPLLGFDDQGGRLGQGKGYYDRKLAALARGEQVFVVGVSFRCQQLPAVPTEVHDRRLDAIVTEEGWSVPGAPP